MYIQITTSFPYLMTLFVCYQIICCYFAVLIHTTPLVDFLCPNYESAQRQCDGRYIYGRKVIFSAAIENRQLKLSVKIK